MGRRGQEQGESERGERVTVAHSDSFAWSLAYPCEPSGGPARPNARRFLLYPRRHAFRFITLESTAMRLMPAIPASIAAFRRGGRGGPPVRFRHICVRFRTDPDRFGQSGRPLGRQEPARARRHPGVHRGSGANGAGEQPRDSDREAESANRGPGRVRARAVYAPAFLSGLSRASATPPPTDFNTSGADTAGLQQFQCFRQRRASAATAVGRRLLGRVRRVAGRRDERPSTPGSTPSSDQASTPPSASRCCATSRSTRTGSRYCSAKNQLQAADLQLQQRLTQTGRSVRAAYYALVGAIAGLEVAQESLNLVAHVAEEQPDPRRGRHDGADRHRHRGGGGREQRGERHHSAGTQIESAQDQLRTLIMNPSQPDFWTARFSPSEQPVLTARAIDVDAAITNALANRTDMLMALPRSRWSPRTST